MAWLNGTASPCWEQPILDTIPKLFTFATEPVSERSLVANEDHSFPVQVAVLLPQVSAGDQPTIRLARRVVLEAIGKNLAGRDVRPAYLGIQLVVATPTILQKSLAEPGKVREPNGLITLWSRIREEEAQQIWIQQSFSSVAFSSLITGRDRTDSPPA